MRRILAAMTLGCLLGLPAGAQDRRVDAHPPGYVPTTVPATWELVIGRKELFELRDGFDLYVYPNIVTEAEARAIFAASAGQYCVNTFNSKRVKLTKTVRHSDRRLDAWRFRGVCD
ncbi:hypothetical protein ILP92_12310 [Maribius pontilimi]|uniref:Uncharacterized protein n=1 Tax=Palleronia pontilimi TaxID=1964209 RepID=A0A934MDI7_9RHOB|nr:hypothetical protein [Palleronia pontilimi]MBJ3763530.1 hypothetical protein [Palleronia pontilimi]